MAETKKTTKTATKATAAKKSASTKTAVAKKVPAKKAPAKKAPAKKVEAKKVEAKKVETKAPVAKKVETKNAKQIKVTYTKSCIGYNKKQAKILESLGLRKLNDTNILPDNDAVRGMIFKIKHLVSVENI